MNALNENMMQIVQIKGAYFYYPGSGATLSSGKELNIFWRVIEIIKRFFHFYSSGVYNHDEYCFLLKRNVIFKHLTLKTDDLKYDMDILANIPQIYLLAKKVHDAAVQSGIGNKKGQPCAEELQNFFSNLDHQIALFIRDVVHSNKKLSVIYRTSYTVKPFNARSGELNSCKGRYSEDKNFVFFTLTEMDKNIAFMSIDASRLEVKKDHSEEDCNQKLSLINQIIKQIALNLNFSIDKEQTILDLKKTLTNCKAKLITMDIPQITGDITFYITSPDNKFTYTYTHNCTNLIRQRKPTNRYPISSSLLKKNKIPLVQANKVK